MASLYAEEPAAKSKCSSRLKSLAQKSLVITTLGLGVLMAPAIYHDVSAKTQGHEHIGHGIYLDWEEIHSQLPDYVLKWLENPHANQIRIARYFSEELEGDYKKQFRLLPAGRKASSYLEFCSAENGERGVCRMKALILDRILKKLGIESQLQVQMGDWLVGGHIWVYLPEHHLVADPTEGRLYRADSYYESILGTSDIETWSRELFSLNDWQPTIFEYAWFR